MCLCRCRKHKRDRAEREADDAGDDRADVERAAAKAAAAEGAAGGAGSGAGAADDVGGGAGAGGGAADLGREAADARDAGAGEPDDGLTPAERAFEELQRRREAKRIKEVASKSHRERIDKLNAYLAKLPVHNDIPKVASAGNG